MSEQETPEPEQVGSEGPTTAPDDATGTPGAPEVTSPAATPADSLSTGSLPDEDDTQPFWRKVPLWGWIAAGAVVVVGAVLGILAGTGAFTPAPLPTPPAETVTAAPPTPTVEPVAREGEPTAFSQALPDTVLDLALADFAIGGPFDETRALESFTLVYGDGGARSVTVYAGQFATEKAATRAMENVLGEVASAERDEVTAGGAVVGESARFVGESGDTVIIWRNTTAVLIARGEDGPVTDLFTYFPL